MSSSKTVYTIFGYDFSELRDEIFKLNGGDWFNTQDGEALTCNQSKGHIQFFNDPMSGNQLFFGYVVNVIEENEDDEPVKIGLADAVFQKKYVDGKLANCGLNMPENSIPYQIITFSEWL